MSDDERAALVDKLASIRRRADGATPGPWRAAHKASYPWPNRSFVDASGASVATTGGTYGTEDDAEFIAASRTDIPALLAIIDGQAERLALAEKTIADALAAHKAGPSGFDKAHVGALHVYRVLSAYDAGKEAGL